MQRLETRPLVAISDHKRLPLQVIFFFFFGNFLLCGITIIYFISKKNKFAYF